eukprot:PLAT3343.2.p1 GENE.PLAT3343.2~~PLAT3343.2.p1  ORF type:complete len:825 (+),score=82.76 PLAT3343.2:88-2562(+)
MTEDCSAISTCAACTQAGCEVCYHDNTMSCVPSWLYNASTCLAVDTENCQSALENNNCVDCFHQYFEPHLPTEWCEFSPSTGVPGACLYVPPGASNNVTNCTRVLSDCIGDCLQVDATSTRLNLIVLPAIMFVLAVLNLTFLYGLLQRNHAGRIARCMASFRSVLGRHTAEFWGLLQLTVTLPLTFQYATLFVSMATGACAGFILLVMRPYLACFRKGKAHDDGDRIAKVFFYWTLLSVQPTLLMGTFAKVSAPDTGAVSALLGLLVCMVAPTVLAGLRVKLQLLWQHRNKLANVIPHPTAFLQAFMGFGVVFMLSCVSNAVYTTVFLSTEYAHCRLDWSSEDVGVLACLGIIGVLPLYLMMEMRMVLMGQTAGIEEAARKEHGGETGTEMQPWHRLSIRVETYATSCTGVEGVRAINVFAVPATIAGVVYGAVGGHSVYVVVQALAYLACLVRLSQGLAEQSRDAEMYKGEYAFQWDAKASWTSRVAAFFGSWYGRHAVATVNYLSTAAVIGLGLVNGRYSSKPVLTMRQDTVALLLTLVSLFGCVASFMTLMLRSRWTKLKVIPLDDSFRVATMIKSLMLFLKVMVVASLNEGSSSDAYEDAVLVLFGMSLLMLIVLTLVNVVKLWREEVQLVGVSRRRLFLLMYGVGFAWVKVTSLTLVIASELGLLNSREHNYTSNLLLLLPAVYMNNECSRFLEGAKDAHDRKKAQQLKDEEVEAGVASGEGGAVEGAGKSSSEMTVMSPLLGERGAAVGGKSLSPMGVNAFRPFLLAAAVAACVMSWVLSLQPYQDVSPVLTSVSLTLDILPTLLAVQSAVVMLFCLE